MMSSLEVDNNNNRESNIDTEKKLTKAFSEHIFKAIVLLLYLQEDKYINYLNDSVNAYVDFIEQHNIVEKTVDTQIMIETNKQLRLWIEYPKDDTNKDLKYIVKGNILFSEMNQPQIYIKIMHDEKNLVKISAAEDWLCLAETIMNHSEVTDKEKRCKLGREGWKYKYLINEDAIKPTLEENNITENKTDVYKIDENKTDVEIDSNNCTLTKDSIYKMKVPELKKYLKDNNLSCVGKKGELKQRLLEYYSKVTTK